MKKKTKKLRPGDFVEVKAPAEILQTLDAEGTLDKLPFMPEMVEFCGRRFQVSKRFVKSFSEVHAGNCSSLEMAQRIGIWLFWRIRRVFLGAYARGTNKSTPAGGINLQPGEWVEVEPMESITETLNESALNRGLYFTPAMRLLCGEQHRVEKKVDKIIVDGTGEMRQLRNTVFLEGSLCGCACVAFGGCPRGEFAYWREIWLRRSAGLAAAKPLNTENWHTPERIMSTTGCVEKEQ